MPISPQLFRPYGLVRSPSITALLAALTLPAFAQYTDKGAIEHAGGPQTFADRRAALAKELKIGRVILFARTEEPEDSPTISPAFRIPAQFSYSVPRTA